MDWEIAIDIVNKCNQIPYCLVVALVGLEPTLLSETTPKIVASAISPQRQHERFVEINLLYVVDLY